MQYLHTFPVQLCTALLEYLFSVTSLRAESQAYSLIFILSPTFKMKLVIAGATGFVGKEILRQALCSSEFDSIVTLGHRAVDVGPHDREKLTDIVLDNLEQYPETVREQLADADACIWY